jgi:hypothetical protein
MDSAAANFLIRWRSGRSLMDSLTSLDAVGSKPAAHAFCEEVRIQAINEILVIGRVAGSPLTTHASPPKKWCIFVESGNVLLVEGDSPRSCFPIQIRRRDFLTPLSAGFPRRQWAAAGARLHYNGEPLPPVQLWEFPCGLHPGFLRHGDSLRRSASLQGLSDLICTPGHVKHALSDAPSCPVDLRGDDALQSSA